MLQLTESDAELMGLLMLKANQLAIAQGLGNGYKTLINTGVNGGQEVYHLHVHVFGNK
jgi:histidine triad (HIT) family protein